LDIRIKADEMKLSERDLRARGFTVATAAAQMQVDWKFFVVEIDGTVAAFCLADRARDTIDAWFKDKALTQGMRGLGQPLFRDAMQWLWANGAERITLTTARNAEIYDWYKRNGWREIRTRPNGYVEFELTRSVLASAKPAPPLPPKCNRCLALRCRVLAAAFLVNTIVSGGLFSLSLSFAGIAERFGVPTYQVASVFSATLLLYFCLGLVSSWSCTRFMPRNLVLAGTAFGAAGMFMCAAAPNFWIVILGFCIGVGAGGAFTYFPSIVAVKKWYRVNAMWALGTSSAGIAAGMAVVPAVAWAFSGLRWTALYFVVGLLCLIAFFAAFWLRGIPQWDQCLPDGRRATAKEEPPPGWKRCPLARVLNWARRPSDSLAKVRRLMREMFCELGSMIAWALCTPRFRLIALAGLFAAIGFQLPVVLLQPFSAARVGGTHDPAFLLTVMGCTAFAGRLLLGAAADRWPPVPWLAAVAFLVGACLVWWGGAADMKGSLQYRHLWWFAASFGLFYGGMVPLYQAVIEQECESPMVFLGAAFLFVGIGSFAGPNVLGADILAGNQNAFRIGAASMLLAAAFIALLAMKPSPWLGSRPS
jgi:MFS family permease